METKPNLSLIWLDTSLDLTSLVSKSVQVQDELRATIDRNLKVLDDDERCEAYIRSQPLLQNIVLLMDDVTAKWMLNRVSCFCQVICTFVIQVESDIHQRFQHNHQTKVKDLFT